MLGQTGGLDPRQHLTDLAAARPFDRVVQLAGEELARLAMLIPALRAARSAFAVVTQADRMHRDAGPLGHGRRHPEHAAGERLERVIDQLAGGGVSERLVGSRGVRARGGLTARWILRGLHNEKTADELLEGWTVHYNYFRPHGSLRRRTPAHAAGIRTDLQNWEDVARLDVRPISHARSQRERVETRKRFNKRLLGAQRRIGRVNARLLGVAPHTGRLVR